MGRSAEPGEQLAEELGERVVFSPGDVTKEDDVLAAVESAALLGPLRIAVNCAGIGSAGRTVGR
ncbi:3-hydroxy-2-methylbutyryl-CoA dehydrogenase, partial [Streptomyces nanshensis]